MRAIVSVLVLALAMWTVGCDDGDTTDGAGGAGGSGGMAGAGGAGGDGTVTLNGLAQDWLDTTPFPFSGTNVCVHNADPAHCTTIDADGNFSLTGLAPETTMNLVFEGAGIFPTIYPIGTGSGEMNWFFTLVSEAAATLVIDGFPGVDSVDETKGHMAIYASAGFLNRGVSGAAFSTEPATANGFRYFDNFGLSMDSEVTLYTGNAVSPNIEPGDYMVSATAPNTTCVSSYDARENAEGGLVAPVMAGYTTFAFQSCQSGGSITASLTVTELNPASDEPPAVEGAEVCVYASAEAGAEPIFPCETTDAEGAVSFTSDVAYTRLVTDIRKEGYLSTRIQGELNGTDFMGAGALALEGIVGAVLGLSGITEGIDPEAGHVLLATANAGTPVEGSTFTLTGEDGDIAVWYFDGSKFVSEGSTVAAGNSVGGAFNLAPGTYTWTVSSGIKTCQNLGGTWITSLAASGTYQIDVAPGTVTTQWVNCR